MHITDCRRIHIFFHIWIYIYTYIYIFIYIYIYIYIYEYTYIYIYKYQTRMLVTDTNAQMHHIIRMHFIMRTMTHQIIAEVLRWCCSVHTIFEIMLYFRKLGARTSIFVPASLCVWVCGHVRARVYVCAHAYGDSRVCAWVCGRERDTSVYVCKDTHINETG